VEDYESNFDDFEERLRSELPASSATDELLVDAVVLSAVRLKILTSDDRSYHVFNNREWDKAYDQASRTFFRNFNLYNRRGQRRQRPENEQSAPDVQRVIDQLSSRAPRPAPPPSKRPQPASHADISISDITEPLQTPSPVDMTEPPTMASPRDFETALEKANQRIEQIQRRSSRRPNPAEALRQRNRDRDRTRPVQLGHPRDPKFLAISITPAVAATSNQATRASPQ
jgi:hypothetical protein